MELLRALSEKKCLLEGRIHTQVCNALHKIVYEMPSEVLSKSPNVSQEEAYDFASSRLVLLDHLLASVLTNVSTYEADTSNSSIAEPNTVYISNTPPSAVVQTEANRMINERRPVEENVTVPVAISNQEAQTVTVSAGMAKEVQTLESTVAQQVATKVSEPTASIERTNVRRSGRVSLKRGLSVFSMPEPQAKKSTRRSAPPAQPTAATRPTTVRRLRSGSWVCAECGKIFNRLDGLTIHVRLHTGEKPYRCIWTECDYSAGDRSNMARHVREVHLNLPRTKKEQLERGIVEERREQDYFIMV